MTRAAAGRIAGDFGWPRDARSPGRRTDAQLLDGFLAGDDEEAERAFAALVERHGSSVQRICRDVLGDPHEAQDAAQAAFLVLARKARTIRDPEALGPWLRGVAIRLARRALAEGMRRREAEHRGAEAMIERARRRGLAERPHCPELYEEIDRLPEIYRQPIVLCYQLGHTQEQAARLLGWPYGTVQTRLHRGRIRLRDRLARRGIGLAGVLVGILAGDRGEASAATDPRGWAEGTAREAARIASGSDGRRALPRPPARAGHAAKPSILGALAIGFAIAVGLLIGRDATSEKPGGPVAAPRAGRVPAVSAPTDAPHEAPAGRPIPTRPAFADPIVRGVGPEGDEAPTPQAGVPLLASLVPADATLNRRAEGDRPEGRELFARAWSPNDPRSRGGDGLGPVFNARSCVDCHDRGGVGGAGSAARNVEIATAEGSGPGGFGYSYSFRMDFGAGQFSYQMGAAPVPSSPNTPLDPAALASIHPGFRESRSLMLHRFGTDRTYQGWRESVPGQHGSIAVRTSQRNPTPLFGAGLIDGIPDEAIVAASARRFPGSERVRGKVSRMADGRVGRFGWKAQKATLEEFVLFAAATEMGLEVDGHPQADDPRLPGLGAPGPDMDRDECAALVDFVRKLPAPVVREPIDARDAATIEAGEATFRAIGCAGCHLPRLADVEGIYSDLLLHDMSPRLADTSQYAVFVARPAGADVGGARDEAGRPAPQEWRTPPLWGLRDSAPYLHDGRAATVAQAIALHGGQGASAAERFAQLPTRRKRQLEAFLLSLSAPPRQGDRDGRDRAE